MPLYLTEDQTMLRDMAAPFLAENAPVAHLRALRDARDPLGFSPDLWARFAEMGLAGVLVPEAQGGAGLGHVEAGIVMEEIGRNLSPSPFLASAVLAATALAHADAELQARWLPGIAEGRSTAALAVDETAKHRPAQIALTAERAGNGFRLNGTKTFVVGGHAADLLILAARTAGLPGETAGLTLFAIDPATAGVTREPVRLLDASLAARLTFADVTVDADAVIGAVDEGWRPLARVLDAGRAAVAAELVGVGAAAFAQTVDYLKTRTQFGRLIGEFQALQHRAAHLYAELEIARAAVLKAQQLLDADDPGAPLMVAVAKAKAGRAATLAVSEGVQMHGGIGMTDAHDIGLTMKRNRVLNELFGDPAFQGGVVTRTGAG